MPIKYDHDPELNIVQTYPYGEHTCQDAFQHFQCLSADDRVKPGFIDVVHYETVESFVFKSTEGKEITRTHNELKQQKSVKAIIFIAHSDIQFGMARLMQILHELNDPEDKVYVVKSESEAMDIIQELQ